MATSAELNVTSNKFTKNDGFLIPSESPVPNVPDVLDFRVNLRKCMIALRLMLNVQKNFPLYGNDRGTRVVLNTVFSCLKIYDTSQTMELVSDYNVRTINQGAEEYSLYTLYSQNDASLLCAVYNCSQLLYAEILYMVNSVLFKGKLNTQKMQLSPEDQTLFLYLFSTTVIYLANSLYGLSGNEPYTPCFVVAEGGYVTELFQLYTDTLTGDADDIVRKLYLLFFYKFQLVMNERVKGAFISDYIE
jgi:hypothetical protein